jgi:amidohydrolase
LNHLLSKIKAAAKANHAEVIGMRRHLHTYPEISFEEYKTSEFIAAKLDEWGISYQKGIVKTGIVATIKGNKPSSNVVALRADMDALPITEQNKVEYASRNIGLMHACGHDVHSASMLGAAKIMNELRADFEGTVKLIFQPGEEKLPGGASLMIDEGVLNDPRPQQMFAQHVFPSMETGKVGFRKGMYMASTDELYLNVKGKGGHAAMPSEYVNPLLITAEILLALDKEFMQQKHSAPTVLAFGKMTASGATNVIPDEVNAEGTFRTMDEAWRKEAKIKMQQIASDIAKKHNGSAVLRIEHGYPFLVNDDKVTSLAIDSAKEYLGEENVEELPLRMTAEDFAFFSQQVPSCFYRLGTGNRSKGITSGVHTATFDIDEDALEIGSGLMAYIAISQLRQGF